MPVNRNDNAVLFWNGVLLEAMEEDSQKPPANQEQGGPTRASRAAAIVHAAIHNAINGVLQRNTFYQDPKTMAPAPPGPPPAGASQQAAGAGAAYRTLRRLYQSQTQTARFNQARADFQALPLPGANHQPSFAYGVDIAQQLLDARANDGSGAPQAYAPPLRAPAYGYPTQIEPLPDHPLRPAGATFGCSCWTPSRGFVRLRS